MRDTLVEIINNFFGSDAAYYDVNPLDLATYLIENGIIAMPCKVDDTMYVKYKDIIRSVKVTAIRIDTKKNNHRICVEGGFPEGKYTTHHYQATFNFDSIGKTLFRTEAEAKGDFPGQINILDKEVWENV